MMELTPKQANVEVQDQLRAELRQWFVSCLSADLEPVQVYEMLLSESSQCMEVARDNYEKTSEIHDFLIGTLSINDPEFIHS